jgi:hypothetical protein
MSRIDMSDYSLHFEDIMRGETLRLNHDDCSAGEDTRRRLYLTRPASSPEVVVGYCHNCQSSGVYRDDANQYRDFNKKEKKELREPVAFEIPAQMDADPDDWPSIAHVWRMEKRLSRDFCQRYGIQYDPASHRMYVPKRSVCYVDGHYATLDSELLGYELRRLDGEGAKYLSAVAYEEVVPSTIVTHPNFYPNTGPIVIVEDLASAVAIALAGWPSLCNYGVKVDLDKLWSIKDYNCAVVWLDNDSEHVEEQAMNMARTWHIISGNSVRTELQHSDPKTLKTEAIKGLMLEWERELGLR